MYSFFKMKSLSSWVVSEEDKLKGTIGACVPLCRYGLWSGYRKNEIKNMILVLSLKILKLASSFFHRKENGSSPIRLQFPTSGQVDGLNSYSITPVTFDFMNKQRKKPFYFLLLYNKL